MRCVLHYIKCVEAFISCHSQCACVGKSELFGTFFTFPGLRFGSASYLCSDWSEVRHQIQRAERSACAQRRGWKAAGRFRALSMWTPSRVESVARISKEINRSNWSSSAMVGDHTISGESALTQRPKNGLSCKMVLQAVGKVLRWMIRLVFFAL